MFVYCDIDDVLKRSGGEDGSIDTIYEVVLIEELLDVSYNFYLEARKQKMPCELYYGSASSVNHKNWTCSTNEWR